MTRQRTHNRIVVGSSWLIALEAVERLIGLVSVTVLARLLAPTDFGVVAVAMTVVAAVELTSVFGFDWALVRHRDLSADLLNTAWTLRALVGLGTFAALALLGPLAAAFFRLPPLTSVLPVLGLASFLGSMENIGTVYFRREFAFHKEFVLRVATKLSGFVVSIPVAMIYRSYWALVVGTLMLKASSMLTSYLLHPFRPRPTLVHARQLFSFSSWVMLGNIVDYFTQKFASLYLGRVFGPHATGLVALATELAGMPSNAVAGPINRVAYSKYSEEVRANRSPGHAYLEIASLIWMISLPMCAGLVAVAPEVARLVLGPRWEGAEMVVSLASVGQAFAVATASTHYVYWALGRSRRVAALSAIAAVIMIPVTIVCAHVAGYRGVVIAWAITSATLVPINFTMLRRDAGIRFADLWVRVWRVTLGAGVMLLVLFTTLPRSTYATAPSAALLLLLVKIVAGAAIYVAVVSATWLACGRPEGPEGRMLQLALQWWKRPLRQAAKP
jgi:O-antigen/teichoic acid export membrane protein